MINLDYKMKNSLGILLTALVALLTLSANSQAQQVGTIGVGEIAYSANSAEDLPSKESVVNALSLGINSALTKTRKFTVLDFQQLEERIEQQNRTLEGYYNKEYSGNAVNQRGLDYILKANITEFGLFDQKRGNSNDSIGLIDIDFELIGVADVTNDFSSSVSAQYSTRVEVANTESKQAILDKAIQQGVDQLVDQLISNLFPIRVMKIDDENGAITLNYGEGLLEVGDTVLVYPLDAEVTVDETGEVIGDAIATLQIITTARRFATAQALDGQDLLEKGQQGQLVLTGG